MNLKRVSPLLERESETVKLEIVESLENGFFPILGLNDETLEMIQDQFKKFTNEDGTFFYKKHKIYLYKEDFENFSNVLGEMTKFIVDEKGVEVISEIHDKDFKSKSEETKNIEKQDDKEGDEKISEVEFEDI